MHHFQEPLIFSSAKFSEPVVPRQASGIYKVSQTKFLATYWYIEARCLLLSELLQLHF